jgi:branched-chain amino acid transport system permease protein
LSDKSSSVLDTRARPARPWLRRLKPYSALLIPVIAYFATTGSPYWARQLVLVAIMGMVVVGLNISFGFAGELALGQTAMYAAGAYVTGCLAISGADLLVTLPASAAAAALIGLISGIPGLRLGGWSLAMVSFFLVLIIPNVVELLKPWTHGYSGLSGIPLMKVAGVEMEFNGYVVVVVIVATLVFAAARNLVVSRFGASLLVLKQSPVLATSLGIRVASTKLMAYVIGAIPAGIAGCLFAYLDGYIGPTSFTFTVAVGFLAASILGGSTSIYGALVGSALLVIGPLQSSVFNNYSLIVYGAFVLVGGLFLSGGLIGAAASLWRIVKRKFRPEIAPRSATTAKPKGGDSVAGETFRGLTGATLVVDHVTKRFGVSTAVDAVNIQALPGQVTAVIGANGSGKTTLLNMISGFYPATSGTMRLGDIDLGGLPAHRRALRGVARTFQTPTIPGGLTVAQVIETARIADTRVGILTTMLRLPKFYRVSREDAQAAREVLELMGLSHLADVQASSLSLGTRRLLEVARALARRPSLVLLDEAASGLDADAVEELAMAIRRIRDAGVAVVLIEHNFPLVLSLANTIYVLRRGKLIASGAPDEIEHNQDVIESYLGRKAGA